MTSSVYDIVDDVYNTARHWYKPYVDPADLRQELVVYATQMMFEFEKWMKAGDHHKVVMALRGAAKVYGLTERGKAVGFEYDDCAWYTPAALAGLMPMVLDDTWDGLTGESENPSGRTAGSEGGTLVAMVMDVRRAMARASFYGGWDPDTANGWDNLERLSELLGGSKPWAPGYRRRERAS